jgi:outer membrane biosynthesis protein TonB
MSRFRTPAIILTASLATALTFAQSSTTPPTAKANPYPSDPANGSTKTTPANSGSAVPVAAPPNAAADAKAEAASATHGQVGIMPGRLIHHVEPEYPEAARSTHFPGSVALHVTIEKDGTVDNLIVTGGPEIFRQAAINAVSQ